jgi:hypothetical protein
MKRMMGEEADRAPNFDIVMGFGMRYLGKPLQGISWTTKRSLNHNWR